MHYRKRKAISVSDQPLLDKRLWRRGTASLEGAMLAAVMIPLAGTLFFLMIRVCRLLHEVVAASMSWPFL